MQRELLEKAPPWFALALREVGVSEASNNARVLGYRVQAKVPGLGSERVPWCAIFANAMLEASGLPGTRSASSQSFRDHVEFQRLGASALGALAVFWRGSQSSGLGHVGFYQGEDDDHVYVLGGNEGRAVAIEPLPKSGGSMGLVGYWWPRKAPAPEVQFVWITGEGRQTTVRTD